MILDVITDQFLDGSKGEERIDEMTDDTRPDSRKQCGDTCISGSLKLPKDNNLSNHQSRQTVALKDISSNKISHKINFDAEINIIGEKWIEEKYVGDPGILEKIIIASKVI